MANFTAEANAFCTRGRYVLHVLASYALYILSINSASGFHLLLSVYQLADLLVVYLSKMVAWYKSSDIVEFMCPLCCNNRYELLRLNVSTHMMVDRSYFRNRNIFRRGTMRYQLYLWLIKGSILQWPVKRDRILLWAFLLIAYSQSADTYSDTTIRFGRSLGIRIVISSLDSRLVKHMWYLLLVYAGITWKLSPLQLITAMMKQKLLHFLRSMMSSHFVTSSKYSMYAWATPQFGADLQKVSMPVPVITKPNQLLIKVKVT